MTCRTSSDHLLLENDARLAGDRVHRDFISVAHCRVWDHFELAWTTWCSIRPIASGWCFPGRR